MSLKDIKLINNQVIQSNSNKLKIDDKKVNEFFIQLKEAASTKRVKNCKAIIQELDPTLK